METKVELMRLFQLEDPNPESANWYAGAVKIQFSKGFVVAQIGHRHKVFWVREFNLTEEEFQKLVVK